MVPGAPVATSGILFAVPAFREWLRLSVRTTYHSPIPLSICGAPCRPALCPSRPPTFPPSDSPALRLSCPPPIAPSDLPARLSVCGSGSGFLPALHLRSFSPSCPPPIASSNLPARLTVCRLGPGSLPALHLRGFSPFRPLSVPPSARPVLCQLCPPVFFCLARLFLFLTPSSIWMGISGEDFPRGQLFCIFPSAGFQHTLIYLIYIRSECRFRTPPGTVLFCRSDAAASLPVCLSACLLVRRPFHLNFFVCCIFLPTSRPTFLHLAASFVRPFSPVALPLLPFSRLIVPSRPNFFRLPHPSPLLPPDLLAPCHTLRPSFFTGRPSQIPAFRPSRHSPIRFFLRLPRPFSRLFSENLPPRSGK